MTDKSKTLNDLTELINIALDEDISVPVTAQTRLREDLGMNSFHFMVLLYLLEDEWHVKPEPEKLSGVITVSELYFLLCRE